MLTNIPNKFVKLYNKSMKLFKEKNKNTKKDIKNIFKNSDKNIKKLKNEQRKEEWKIIVSNFSEELKYSVIFMSFTLFIAVVLKILLEKINFTDVYLVGFEEVMFILFYDSFLSKLFFLIVFLCIIFFLVQLGRYLFDLFKKNEIRFFHASLLLIFLVLLLFQKFFLLLGIFIIIEFMIFLLILTKKERKDKKENISILISDKTIDCKSNDKLGMFVRAQKFFTILLNGNSPDNQVFGLVAEWGTGKSSFLNFLKGEEIHYSQYKGDSDNKEKILFVNFNPWYYERESELLEKLLDEIIATLKIDYDVGSLGRNFSKLGKILDDNSSHMFGFSFPFSSLFFSSKSPGQVKKEITKNLQKIDKKLVIIIDDLDRVTSDKFIEILKIVDLTKDFYNTSFILCYDPQNFNVIDTKLIQTQRIKQTNIEHIDTQSFDNSELTRYMGKIITSTFSIHVNKKNIENEFIKILDDKNTKGFEFGPYSLEAIHASVGKLFEYENYIIWEKYLSNLRDLKRCVNFLISIIYSSINDKNSVEYFDKTLGLRFDIFIKLCLLQMHHYSLYKDIENEITISDSIYGIDSKYLLKGYLNNKEEKVEYTKYLNGLKISEQKFLTDLFPTYLKNSSGFNDKEKYQLREFQNLKPYIDLLTGNFSKVASDMSNNRYILNLIDAYLEQGQDGKTILDEIYLKGGIEFINNFLNKFPDSLNKINDGNKKNELSLNLIGSLINKKELYKFYENDFSFNFYIARILNESVKNIKSDTSHISNFVYGKGEFTKALPVKIFEISKEFGEEEAEIGEEEAVKGLVEGLRLILAADTSRGGAFSNFEKEVNTKKLYELIIYPYFEENYIKSEKNFVEYIYEFEHSNKQKILGHLLYMLLHYAPEEKKKILTKYFIEGFKIDQEYFFEWIIRHIDDGLNSEPQIIMLEVMEYFDKETFEAFIQENNDDFKDWMKKGDDMQVTVSSKYNGHEPMTFTYRELLEKYEKSYENYFLKKEK